MTKQEAAKLGRDSLKVAGKVGKGALFIGKLVGGALLAADRAAGKAFVGMFDSDSGACNRHAYCGRGACQIDMW